MNQMTQIKFSQFSEAEKTPPAVKQMNQTTKTEQTAPTTPTDEKTTGEKLARIIIEMYLKEARTPEDIAKTIGGSVDVVRGILTEYSNGKHGAMHFSPAFHDYAYDFYLAHKDLSLAAIERDIFLRPGILKGIVCGRRYSGLKHTKREVMAAWEDKKPEPKEDVQDVEALRNELDTVRREVNVLRQKQDIMADAFDSLATRVAQAAVALVHGRKDTPHD